MVDNDPFIRADVDNKSASIIQVESSKFIPWLLILAIICGASVITNVALIYTYRDFRTQEWLKNNDLTFFKTNDFADIKAQMQVNQSLITAYGLKKACKEK